MKFLDRLRSNSKETFDKIYNHPFLIGMANGDLPIECYKRYMLQDYLYVQKYIKLFALATIRAETDELKANFASGIEMTIVQELGNHRESAIKLGIPPKDLDETELAPTATAYMNFLTCVAHTGTMSEIVASMLPCTWTYAEIGKNLLNHNGKGLEHPIYGEWIRTYSDDEFIEGAMWIVPLMEELAENKTNDELNRIEYLFTIASRYEYLFWDMGYKGCCWPYSV